ncbi:HNH endonuclease [Actinacidiphila sp. ITFR-21]|uniref:HNH endonuclease n=1 Tax=Actinacidiphila sp. ITFR-21 TaxID=3075199 RepID=UPI002889CECE|nr:HNH endonuclease [Streptomyces sp. ITFR-21]WNI16935.1 HNH endonuclease [Streptomyces sp. ITFR-21]
MTDHLGGALVFAAATCIACGEAFDAAHARGMCGRCYRRTRKQAVKAGTFTKLDRTRPLVDRLLEKVAAGPNCCIIWTAHLNNKGYGTIGSGGKRGKMLYAHRAAYAHFVGPIPEGMLIDHRCHNEDVTCAGGLKCLHRRCINPHHLDE